MSQNNEKLEEENQDKFNEKNRKEIENDKPRIHDPLNVLIGFLDVIKSIFR